MHKEPSHRRQTGRNAVDGARMQMEKILLSSSGVTKCNEGTFVEFPGLAILRHGGGGHDKTR